MYYKKGGLTPKNQQAPGGKKTSTRAPGPSLLKSKQRNLGSGLSVGVNQGAPGSGREPSDGRIQKEENERVGSGLAAEIGLKSILEDSRLSGEFDAGVDLQNMKSILESYGRDEGSGISPRQHEDMAASRLSR